MTKKNKDKRNAERNEEENKNPVEYKESKTEKKNS